MSTLSVLVLAAKVIVTFLSFLHATKCEHRVPQFFAVMILAAIVGGFEYSPTQGVTWENVVAAALSTVFLRE